MPMVCPKCFSTFENHRQCPRCIVSLEFRALSADSPALEVRWHQSLPGRIFSGLLITLGLSYGLLKLVGTVMGEIALPPMAGLIVFFGAQGIAVMAGGTLVGVGRRNGFAHGFLLGVITGTMALVAFFSGWLEGLVAPFASDLLPIRPGVVPGANLEEWLPFTLPFLHAFCGTIGGLIGCLTWKPPPEINMPVLISKPEVKKDDTGLQIKLRQEQPSEQPSMFAGKISWFRIMLGIGVAICGGSFGTEPVKQFILTASEGGLEIRDQLQNQVTLGEIFALSILIGGVVAGSNSTNGLKQGLIVGILSGLGMLPFLMSSELGEYTVFVVLSTIFIAPLGGWFGSTLLPPPPPPKYTMGAVD